MAGTDSEALRQSVAEQNKRLSYEQELDARAHEFEPAERWFLALHESRRTQILTVLLSLGAGMITVAALLFFEAAGWLQDEDFGQGSLVWTIAVAGLSLSAIAQLAIAIVDHRRLRATEAYSRRIRSPHSAE